MQEMENKDNNTTMMALAALMFFSPFIAHTIRTQTTPLADKDKSFIGGYCTLWYITLFLLILSTVLGVTSYLYTYAALGVAYTVAMWILLLLLLIGSICIIAGVPLHLDTGAPVFFAPIQEKKSAILYFLPFYNIWMRYHLHSFQNPNRRLKESLLRWTFFLVLCVSNHPVLLSILLIIITLRAATLFVGIDILPFQVKEQINHLFTKNPEELRWYISGTIVYGARSFARIFHTPILQPSLQASIDQEKELYSRLYPIKWYPLLWIEYLIGGALLTATVLWLAPGREMLSYYLPLIILGGRYLIMIVVWQHLPRLPLAREILLLLRLPFFLFSRRTHE